NELDPHSNFLDSKSYKKMQEEQKGSFFGLGITLSKLNGMLTVISPIEGTPAYKAGIRAGDIILEINGVPTKDESIDVSVSKLRGPKGTQVNITIVREGYQEPLHFTLTRDEIPINSIPYSFLIDTKTGYIKIKSFTETTEEEMLNALAKMQVHGMERLILDLRGDSGGLLEMATEIADTYLPKGTLITYTKGRTADSNQDYNCDRTDKWEQIPLIILVDRGTASASEIVSGAIQDHDRGLIIGQTTWGKALVQSVYRLKYDTALALTTAKYYTPSGRLIQRSYKSLYDYFFEFEDEDQQTKEVPHDKIYYTDTGRKVYGGGGITPDIMIIPKKFSKFMDRLFRQLIFFNFAKKYEAAEQENAANSILIKLERNFIVDDAMLSNFKNYLESEKITFNDEEFENDKELIKKEIEREIRLALWGTEDAYKKYLQTDEMVTSAMEHFDEAIALYDEKIKNEENKSAKIGKK
ncbi:MAG: hypothetical protein A2Y62_19105, partial [Candidatus Fischerbacteria bacterium RBG_13_37_8]